MIYRGLVVTGTGTGVGKTSVARALAGLFRESGLKVGVLKPVETGCEGENLVPRDGLALAEAAGIEIGTTGASIGDVVPWRFAMPLAPSEAAAHDGAVISVDRIYQAMDRWMDTADLVVVETAGGVMVPINQTFTFADLLKGLDLPIVIAADNRLGVINHALLTIEAIRARGLAPIGVVLSQLDPAPDRSVETNAKVIERHGGVPCFEVPFIKGGDAAEALRPYLDRIRENMEADWRRVASRHMTPTHVDD